MVLSRLFKRGDDPAPPAPRVPDDVRVYAIGDIHGCDAEFANLLEKIDADHAQRPPKTQILILLGDLVDRGPASAAVVARAMRLAAELRDVRLIAGNHEELLLQSCRRDRGALRTFARFGGRETAMSYGVSEAAYDAADIDELGQLLSVVIPAQHLAFIEAMSDLIIIGDYAFVHAGIRPGVPLAEQKGEDLRWIRDRFLNYAGPHEKVVVHGHTITERVDERPNRIGIDTGAYATGHLTAIGLEHDRRWFLQT